MTRRHERGSGLLGTLIGIGAIVAMIGLAANVCLGLWTRSTIEAVAQDAARDIAATPGAEIDPARIDAVLGRARDRLGAVGDRTSLVVERIDEAVTLHVRHPGVSLLPRLVEHRAAFGSLDERIVVRREGAA